MEFIGLPKSDLEYYANAPQLTYPAVIVSIQSDIVEPQTIHRRYEGMVDVGVVDAADWDDRQADEAADREQIRLGARKVWRYSTATRLSNEQMWVVS